MNSKNIGKAGRPFPKHSYNMIRPLIIILSSILITGSFLTDMFGFGMPGSFGTGQIILVGFGMLTLLAGLLWTNFPHFYRGLAIISLNTLLIIALLELVAIIIARSGLVQSYSDITLARYLQIPYYLEQDWTEDYWREAKQAEDYRYEPYVGWRHRPFQGDFVNIDDEGIRLTPGADCQPEAYTVFTFGGSSMWGWGSPDSATIPAFLQKGMDEIIQGPVCVVNFGEDAYVSTQGRIKLSTQLQKGNVPDIVIFFDGFNDVYVAYESGTPGAHPMLDDIAARFEGRGNALQGFVQSSRQYYLAKQLLMTTGYYDELAQMAGMIDQQTEEEILLLSDEVVYRYLGNIQIVASFAREFEFDYFFFWQPHLAVGNKILNESEQVLRNEFNPVLVELARNAYRQIDELSSGNDHLWTLAGVFKGYEQQIWIDAWGHITPQGNQIIAQAMLEVIQDQLLFD
jgi:lysophospholipase L1-like esterase